MITPGDQIFDMGAIIRRHNVLNGLRFSLLESGLIALLVAGFLHEDPHMLRDTLLTGATLLPLACLLAILVEVGIARWRRRVA